MTEDINNMMGSLNLNDYNNPNMNSYGKNTNPLNNMQNYMVNQGEQGVYNKNFNNPNQNNMYYNMMQAQNNNNNFMPDANYYPNSNNMNNMYDYNMMLQQDQYLRSMTQQDMSPQE